MSISCADIPKLPGLESISFRAGLTGGQRIVRWPYVAENESIQEWVSGGELVFVTGINHTRDESNLCQLVREASDSQVAGLVILTGPEFIQKIPKSVLELANQLQVPLFEQPYDLKMVIVTEIISNAIVQDNLLGKSIRLFLTKLINGFQQAPELIHLRAKDLGISSHSAFVSLSLSYHQSSEAAASSANKPLQNYQQIEQSLEALLRRRNIEWPVLSDANGLLAVWPTQKNEISELYEDLAQLRDRLQSDFPQLDLCMGVSTQKQGLDELSQAVEEAKQALQFAIKHPQQKLFFYDQLGIAQLFAAIPQRNMLAEFCKRHLGSLCFCRDTASTEMKSTLEHYFNHFGHLQHTADAMGIHRNTLSYRLGRIEQRLGYSLQDPFSRLNLQNALLIEQILFHHHNLDEQQHTLVED